MESMRILAIVSGEYGKRHVANIRAHGPQSWRIVEWLAPAILPPVIDYPEDYLPGTFAPADLILSFAELKGVAELLPDIAEMCGARGVLLAVDNEAWLPKGLERQLHGWLAEIGVACATPKPLCSLTEHDYGTALKKRAAYDNAQIAEFARYFGRPELQITIHEATRTIAAAEVKRDAVCGCTRYVAERLVGLHVDEVVEKAGLLHHHFPCLASMQKLPDFNYDTLMHASGHVLQDNIAAQIKPYRTETYVVPGKRSDNT
jgi:thymidylate synthase